MQRNHKSNDARIHRTAPLGRVERGAHRTENAHIEKNARESTETTPSRVSRGLETQPNINTYTVYTYRGVLTTTHFARLAVVGITRRPTTDDARNGACEIKTNETKRNETKQCLPISRVNSGVRRRERRRKRPRRRIKRAAARLVSKARMRRRIDRRRLRTDG